MKTERSHTTKTCIVLHDIFVRNMVDSFIGNMVMFAPVIATKAKRERNGDKERGDEQREGGRMKERELMVTSILALMEEGKIILVSILIPCNSGQLT